MLALIIYGTRSIASTAGTGQFTCPRCCMTRSYSHRHMRAYFTLYFIPLIPMWKNGEYVECHSCGGTYGVEVLSLRMEDLGLPASSSPSRGRDLPNLPFDVDELVTPALEDPRTVLTNNVRRSLVLFIASIGQKATPAVMDEFRSAFQDLTSAELLDDQVYQDYQQAKQAGATVGTFVPRQLGQQSVPIKQGVFKVAARIAAAEGIITSAGHSALMQFGQALGLDASSIQTIIQRKGR